MKIQAAALERGDKRFVVAVARMDLVKSSAEADMAIDQLSPKFSDLPVVLMAQKEDGSPAYYGDADLVELLRWESIEDFPWQEYSV